MAETAARGKGNTKKKKIARFRKELRLRTPEAYVDYTLILLIMLLMAFGFVMLYSTSSYVADLRFGDSMYFLKRQMMAAAIGIVFMALTAMFPYPLYKRLAIPLYLLALALCIVVLFIGTSTNGSSRWLGVGSLSFQPSELGKVAMIIFMATFIAKTPKGMRERRGILMALGTTLPMFLIVAYENLSTGAIILGIVIIMLFVASPKYRPWFIAGIAGFALAVVGVRVLGGYRADRIEAWLHPETSDKAYQTRQALYAIGSGGFFGKGLGESMQKNGFVPEAQNDMIFSIICEELGLFGAICLIILFLVLIWRLAKIAIHCRDMFGSYLVIGIMAHMALQFLLNIAVVTNLLPNTGVTLPFISYGGSALVITLGEMGIALNVSRRTDPELDEV